MEHVTIQLLGALAIRGVLGCAQGLARRTQAVLTAMALAPANWVSREQLCALLWPDRSDAQARQSLSQALSALRRGLGEAAILADRNAAGLASQEIVVDVVRFSELAAHGDLVSLGEAASLLHGPLLPGFFVGVDSFDDWLALERARIGSEAVSAMLRLVH